MIKKRKKYLRFFFAAIVLLCSNRNWAQNSSTQEVSAAAAIYAPLRLLKLTDLSFGSIVQGPNGGNVVMSERGSRSFPTDPLGPSAYNGLSTLTRSGAMAASFIVTGEPSNSYSISTPATVVVSDGSHEMIITLGKPIGQNVSPEGTMARLSSEGTDAWKIGGTLIVGARQPSGLYTGSFTEIITYE